LVPNRTLSAAPAEEAATPRPAQSHTPVHFIVTLRGESAGETACKPGAIIMIAPPAGKG
jgi:hypothetical protein